MTDKPARGVEGTTHRCESCGNEVLLGAGHRTDFALCVACGADFVVEYAATVADLFGQCSLKTPGTLIWSNSDALKADDRDNPIEVRRDVFPLPDSELPDLRRDACPKCKSVDSLVLHVPDECECPKCHTAVLTKIGGWIQ